MVHRIVMMTSRTRPRIRAGLALLLTLLAAGSAGAQQRIDQRMPAAPVGLLRIQNFVGAVRVTGWDRDSIAVTGTVGTGEFYFGVGKGSGKLGVFLPPKVTEGGLDAAQAKGQIVPSVLEVRVPHRTRVWVKTASASIDVQDVTGGLDLYAVGGTIRVRGAPQDLYAESMDGSVELDITTSSARVRSAGGAVSLRGEIENAVVTSVSGAITITGARLQRGRFVSVTGELRYDGGVVRGSSLAFESHAGPIVLTLPADVSADFDVTAFNGEIRNALARLNPSLGGDLRSKLLEFTAGEGGAQVTVTNFKGDIVLGRR
jgi:hypothetical protein